MPDPPDPPLPPEPPEPLPPELPSPDTCWPTDRSTDATTPVIGEVRLASASACLASVTWFSAAVTAAWSAVSCALVTAAAWSDESLAASVASVASACATSADSDAELTVASTFPAVTFSPTVAETEVTWPEVAKLRFACWAGSIVPLDETVCRSVLDAAATSWDVGVAAAEESSLSQIPTPAAASTTTTPPASTARCLRLIRCKILAIRPLRRWLGAESASGVSAPNTSEAMPVTAHHHPRQLPQRRLGRVRGLARARLWKVSARTLASLAERQLRTAREVASSTARRKPR